MSTARSRADRRATVWVLRWASFYTRGLPIDVANTRRDELASDLWEHATGAATTTPRERRTLAAEIGARAVLGMGADLSWRGQQLRREHRRQSATVPRRRHPETARMTTGIYALAAVMIVAALSGGARAALNVSYLSSPGAPAVLLLCGVLACAAVFLFTRPGSRLVGGAGLAVLAFPIGWALMYALPSISAEGSQLYAVLMRPVLELPPLPALGAMLLPEVLFAGFFLLGTFRVRRTVDRSIPNPGSIGNRE